MSNKEERKAPVLRFKGFTDDWEQRKLKELVNMHARIGWQGLRKSEFLSSGNYYIITGTDFDNNRINLKNISYISKDRYDQDKNIQVHPNDILLTKDGTIGKVAYVDSLDKPATLNAGVYDIKNKSSELETKYLFHYLTTNRLLDYAKKSATGGTIKHLNQKILVDFPIEVSSKNEEKNIANLLDKIDKIITLQQRKLSLIEKLRENISEHIFSPDIMKFKNIDPEFEIKKLSDISNIFIGLVTTMTKNYAKNGILLIRNSNIKENNFKFDNYIYLDSKFAEKNKNREMKIGDVVTVHTGDIGTSAVIEPKEENSIGFATITTRPNNKIINSYYLSDYLNTKKHKNWAVRMSTGDGRRNYNLKDFTRIRLNVPSLNYQIKIVALIKYLESFSKSEKKKINQLNSLKQFLLQNLFI